MINSNHSVIELVVRNHPGAMSHITGLFARKAFNLEGILCGQIGDGSTSCMFLLVKNDNFMDQIIKQLRKLYDVLEVTLHDDYDYSIFNNLDKLFKTKTSN